MKNILIASTTIFLLVLSGTYFHLIYTVDTVASSFGGDYYISTFAVPLVLAIVVALLTYAILDISDDLKIKVFSWLLLSSSLGAILPAGLALWALNQPH